MAFNFTPGYKNNSIPSIDYLEKEIKECEDAMPFYEEELVKCKANKNTSKHYIKELKDVIANNKAVIKQNKELIAQQQNR